MVAPYFHDYGEINNGAHRKAAELIGAPALIWHQALWNPESEREGLHQRAQNIKAYPKLLQLRIGQEYDPIKRSLSEAEVGDTDRARVHTFCFIWEGLRTKIRVEVHTEYVSITSIVDLSVDVSGLAGMDKKSLREKYHVYRMLEAKIGELQEGLDFKAWKERSKLSPECDECRAFTGKMRDLHRELYEVFWEQTFDQKILDASGFLAAGTLGRRFADFRGIITCEQYPPDPKPHREDIELARIFENPLQRPFYRGDESRRGQWQRIAIPSELWARARLNAAWPFVTAMEEILPDRMEFTAACFNDGRMLHVSALGPQPTDGTKGGERPIFYYLHSATQCERQIGRLVDRACQLGSLRLASIIALPALKSVGQSLRDVERRMTKTRGYIQELIAKAHPATSSSEERAAARQQLGKVILDEFYDVQRKMAAISIGEDFYSKELGNESLDFRLARSSYYRTQFNSLMGSLRVKRIEGYQPYNEFVKRRLESAFAFMDSVERRLREIKSDLRTLDQLYLTTNITILTGEIDDEQKQTKNVQEQIRTLQLTAEIALLAVLLPYYLFGLVFSDFSLCGLMDCHWFRLLNLDMDKWVLLVFVLSGSMLFVIKHPDETWSFVKNTVRSIGRLFSRRST